MEKPKTSSSIKSSKYKKTIPAIALSLLVNFTSCDENKKDQIPKKLDNFEFVSEKEIDDVNRFIYETKVEKGDGPGKISAKFDNIDNASGDFFAKTGYNNIMDEDFNINPKNLKIGDKVYIKAKKYSYKESMYDYKLPKIIDDKELEKNISNLKEGINKIKLNNGETINIEKDSYLLYYIVEEDDFYDKPMYVNGTLVKKCINFTKIREKLSKIKGLEYLQKDEYKRIQSVDGNNIVATNKIKSVNINIADIAKHDKSEINDGRLKLPLPCQESFRMFDIPTFASHALQIIEEMKTDKIYGPKIKELLCRISKEELLEFMLTVAYTESSSEGFDKIGEYSLHRREGGKNQAFSFSHYHILMKENEIGQKARDNLNFTNGDTYHPKNASKLFLAFYLEMVESMSKPVDHFFPFEKKYKQFARAYNGPDYKSNKYDKNLRSNHSFILEKLSEFKKDLK